MNAHGAYAEQTQIQTIAVGRTLVRTFSRLEIFIRMRSILQKPMQNIRNHAPIMIVVLRLLDPFAPFLFMFAHCFVIKPFWSRIDGLKVVCCMHMWFIQYIWFCVNDEGDMRKYKLLALSGLLVLMVYMHS